jgi:hypothetical protein
MTSAARPALALAFRRAALPLGCYYTVTLLMPLANGAAQPGGIFVHHALVVLIVPPVLILAFCTIDATVGVLAKTWTRALNRSTSCRALSRGAAGRSAWRTRPAFLRDPYR